jgi:glycosyltransferase involved in cell wall biosynthesis
MTKTRRLLSIAHSYVVGMNRRLAHEMARANGRTWEVTAVAPTYFHGTRDLRPLRLDAAADEPCRLVPVNAYLTHRVHVFFYGWRLRALLQEPWDLVHCWEEPYILVGAQVAWWAPPRTPLVFRTAQSLAKSYPIPFNWVEKYTLRRAAGWICSGSLVAQTLGARPGYDQLPRAQIPLGVDVDCFRPDRAAGRAVRQSLGWSDDGPPVVGYLGRFVPERASSCCSVPSSRCARPGVRCSSAAGLARRRCARGRRGRGTTCACATPCSTTRSLPI